MRDKRTPDEERILSRIETPLRLLNLGEWDIDPDVIDAPDIVLTKNNRRLGVEISRLDYEEHCHWRHLTAGNAPTSRAAEVTIDLEKLLEKVARKKWSKYQGYKKNNELSECWLVLFNDAFEIKEQAKSGHPDKKWFEKHARLTLQELKCPFDRVGFNLQHPDLWYHIYKKSHRVPRDVKITRWPSIILKEVSVQITGANVTTLDFNNMKHRKAFS